MKYFLGIDVSTTATKALLIDQDGSVVAISATEYGYDTPRPLWSEQNPELWWQGAVSSIRDLLNKNQIQSKDIVGVGLTGQMHGLVMLDEQNKVLRPAILWNDQRTNLECDLIRQRIGKDQLIRITGNDALPGFTAPKILWVQNNEPEIYKRVKHILLPKDYVRYRLTGKHAMDKADGAGTILMDIRARDWSTVVLDSLGIPRECMPPLFEGPDITGSITPEAAVQTGLPAGIPVVAGGGDQAAQAVGVGAVEEGIVALTLGTSGVVFVSVNTPMVEPEGRLHGFCHAVPGKWHLMGVMLSAAGSLRWYRDTFAPGTGYEALLEPASRVPHGSEGLLFLPYLTGERTPYPDPYARGCFIGLTVRHGFAHMTRAVLEGVAFGLRDGFELMRNAGLSQIRQVRVSGGGARSALWRQILADVLETELVTVNTTEGAAFGAAILAGVGTGQWSTVESACQALVHVVDRTKPDLERFELYAQQYQNYQALYPALRGIFPKMVD